MSYGFTGNNSFILLVVLFVLLVIVGNNYPTGGYGFGW
ncbi:YjcZ family sporulation protein [Radiobacillus deserti]|uniref:YjcZ family sporulation protein n=1 Tax=Radiobacillus deserti TaxID=2594883 RepID=A0A516KK24_9BACI|nr:YjcZ family sporulation protein [Radiobacillus deserti]QDP41734.1 YjcZ family sporulation protein [Radiobacillus deserti]